MTVPGFRSLAWLSVLLVYTPFLGGQEKPESKATQAMVVTQDHRQFWSFRPLNTNAPPQSQNASWPRNPIDHFILVAQEKKGLHPNSNAEPRTLARRAWLDLWGMPPSPEALHLFLNNSSPLAWEELLDHLLSSPHYGERWARHWMDVARFAESSGFEHDDDRKNAYHYRDFLIRAFNQDLPYNQFIQWQVAGDEMAPDNPMALSATGFLGAGVFPTQLTETEFESARYDELDDMANTTGVAFLGLSVGCARCHDHKFDPIPTRDYYRLTASFATTIRSETEFILNPMEHRDQLTAWEQEKKKLEKSSDEASLKKHLETKPKPDSQTILICSEGVKPLKHHADGRGYPHFYPKVHLLNRGDVRQKQEEVNQGFLQVLMRNGRNESFWRQSPKPESKQSFRRTSLARWLTDESEGAGHLAARVMVNRLWQHHFGQGLVATPNDFGSQGTRPTHPELLDWLAHYLIQQDWKLKPLHKLIMSSAVYRQTSEQDPKRTALDIHNAYLWRFAPRRLEAEAIRDSLLAVSGTLDPTLYGPGTLVPAMLRRSVYFTVKRSRLIPMMQIFDWPEHQVSIGRRASTTIAPQALAFMNSPQVRHYADAMATRVQRQIQSNDPAAIAVHLAYELALSRQPSAMETALAQSFLNQQSAHYPDLPATEGQSRALADFCQVLIGTSEFLYIP